MTAARGGSAPRSIANPAGGSAGRGTPELKWNAAPAATDAARKTAMSLKAHNIIRKRRDYSMSVITQPAADEATHASAPPPGPPPAHVDEAAAVADYTETVVPQGARRSNWRMFLQFSSMQLVFGAVLVGYTARFQGLTLGQLAVAMAIAVTAMTVYCI